MRAWTDGYPHRALDILADAGMDDQDRRAFVREAVARARQRTVRLLR